MGSGRSASCAEKLIYVPWSAENRPKGKNKTKTTITYIPVLTSEVENKPQKIKTKSLANVPASSSDSVLTSQDLSEAMNQQTMRSGRSDGQRDVSSPGTIASKSTSFTRDNADEHDDAAASSDVAKPDEPTAAGEYDADANAASGATTALQGLHAGGCVDERRSGQWPVVDFAVQKPKGSQVRSHVAPRMPHGFLHL